MRLILKLFTSPNRCEVRLPVFWSVTRFFYLECSNQQLFCITKLKKKIKKNSIYTNQADYTFFCLKKCCPALCMTCQSKIDSTIPVYAESLQKSQPVFAFFYFTRRELCLSRAVEKHKFKISKISEIFFCSSLRLTS